jgi:hypothetical protein
MSKINLLLGCPTDCGTNAPLLPFEVDQLCTDYRVKKSQLSDLFFVPNGAQDPFAAFDSGPATYVANSIDNTTADGSKAHWLVGKGGKPAAEKEVTVYPHLRKRTTSRTYTISFEVLNLSDTQYNALRKMQCGSTDFTFYYGDVENHLYGKQGGLAPESIDVDFPQGAGDTDKSTAIITLTFMADGDPIRRNNPYN